MGRIGTNTKHCGPANCSGHSVSVRSALAALLLVAPSGPAQAAASDFVGSSREYGLTASFLVSTALLEAFPLNDDRPLMGGEQRPYVATERVPDWMLVVVHCSALGSIQFTYDGDDPALHARGYVMAASMNAFATSLTKAIVGRRRPNYDDAKLRGVATKSKSFYSGHASNSFMIATYASLYTWRRTESVAWRAAVPPILYSAAAYTAWSRVADHRHYTSDVIVGAAAGTAVSAVVFRWYDGMGDGEPASAVRMVPYPGGVSATYRF